VFDYGTKLVYFLSMKKKAKQQIFNSTEEVISMILGLGVVIVIIALIINFFVRRKGEISIPGISDQKELTITKNSDVVKSESEYFYEVKAGDSLWSIAQTIYGDGFKYQEIADNNLIKNPSAIEPGMKLKINKVETKEMIGGEYTIARGDSLWKIALKSYGDGYQWVLIWENNKQNIKNPNKLEVGTKIVIPKK